MNKSPAPSRSDEPQPRDGDGPWPASQMLAMDEKFRQAMAQALERAPPKSREVWPMATPKIRLLGPKAGGN